MSLKMIASDYDGTIANDGAVAPDTVQALCAAKDAGWLLALVTGRMLESLGALFPQLDLFDLVVAENGAVIYLSAQDQVVTLAGPPSPRLTQELTGRDVPFYVGRVVVGMKRQYEQQVTEAVRVCGEELRPIFNKNDIMVLPVGIDKAAGLRAGIGRFGITSAEVVGIGDAENDVELFQACGVRVAVANALEPLKAQADIVTRRPNGAGVAEYIHEHLLRARSG